MKRSGLVFVLATLMLLTQTGYGQDHSSETIVVFDPLFWKDQLKLDEFQCRKIKEINTTFYQQLSVVSHNETNRNDARRKAEQSLMQRSEEIWETFHPKQRKRWKKMWQDNYIVERSNET
jgi:trehalose/maltose hydrolase-like predicted phosphorylase